MRGCQIKAYMESQARFCAPYVTGEINTTALAELAARHYGLYGLAPEYEVPKELYDWAQEVAERLNVEIEADHPDTTALNITATLHGPPAVTSVVQACLNIRSLRKYLERQIKEEVGNIAKVGTVALMCKVHIEEAIDNDAC